MIRTAIIGGADPDAGELIRILTGHPDVEIIAVQAAGLEGRQISSHHHGLIGERLPAFTATLSPGKYDVIFVCGQTIGAQDFARLRAAAGPETKIICFNAPLDDKGLAAYAPLSECEGVATADTTAGVYALPEINRKQLVRGAANAFLPSAFASMALVALYPLALNMLLKGDIALHFSAPEEIIAQTDIKAVEEEINGVISNVQKSYDGRISILTEKSPTRRSAQMTAEFGCQVNSEHLLEIYGIYDDHNFSFAVDRMPGVSEVAGTDKCIVSVEKPDESSLRLGCVADCRLRGASGEAVHVMNLLCGLHEKTGLALKAIDFTPIESC
mgnify:FL=1